MISKIEYEKAKEIVKKYLDQENKKVLKIENNCKHNWILVPGWDGRLEGNTYCSKCKKENPSNYN